MRTILVVDDDQWVRMLARDVLAGEGYRVLEGSDGQDAIRVAAEHPGPIHLLLSDVMMPGMNGCDLAAGLTALLPGMRSEEHTSELQSHSGISYAVFCLDRKSVV